MNQPTNKTLIKNDTPERAEGAESIHWDNGRNVFIMQRISESTGTPYLELRNVFRYRSYTRLSQKQINTVIRFVKRVTKNMVALLRYEEGLKKEVWTLQTETETEIEVKTETEKETERKIDICKAFNMKTIATNTGVRYLAIREAFTVQSFTSITKKELNDAIAFIEKSSADFLKVLKNVKTA